MSTGADLAWLDATAQADLVRRREVSALELVDAAIANIERLDGRLNAVIHRRFELARAEALTPKHGPFAGVPFLVKDLIAHSRGDPFHEGIRGVATQQYRARADTALIRRSATLCLRLQRGSGIRRWALRAAGRGTRGGGARGEGR
jgi:amidase